jgi:hypothetical protein
MEQQEINKFKTVEILLGLIVALGFDGIAALLDLSGIGAFITFVAQWFAIFVFGFWFKSKGNSNEMKTGRMIFKQAIQLLPATPLIITALTVTIPFIIGVFIHNNPEKFAKFLQTAAGGKLLEKLAK